MECSLAIKGLGNARILHDLQSVFSKLTDMEFSFIDPKGKPVVLPQYSTHFFKTPLASKKKKSALFLDLLAKACDHASSSKKPHLFEYGKLPFAAIPVIVEEKAICALLMCPSQSGKLQSRPVSKEEVKNSAELLFILINYIFKKEFDFLVVTDSDKQYSRNQEAVIKAVAYIKKNYHDKDISLQKVSQEVALSHYYFSHIFKDELKITFIKYLTKVRMEASAKLLKNRNININQIAYAVGYQDPNYFSKVFKRYTKTSPVDYRSNLLKKEVKKQIITV